MSAFIRNKEDFVCGHCGATVHGTGYTNHCPQCLWSKHADVEPGDRANPCGGMMEPVALLGSTPKYVILHRCTLCGTEKKNKAQKEDSQDALVRLARRTAA